MVLVAVGKTPCKTMVGQSRLLVGESRLLVGQSRLFGKLFFPRCSLHPSKKSKGAWTDLPLQNRGQDWPPLIWNAQLPCTPGIKDGPLKLRIIPGVPRCCSEQGRKGSGRVDLGGRSLAPKAPQPGKTNITYHHHLLFFVWSQATPLHSAGGS